MTRPGGPVLWRSDTVWRPEPLTEQHTNHAIGEIVYSVGGAELKSSPLIVPEIAQTYGVLIPNQVFVPGLFVASHRSLSAYESLASIPLQFSASSSFLDEFIGVVRSRWDGGGGNPLWSIKSALIAAAIFGEGNSAVSPDHEAWEIWTGFQDVLRAVLPPSLGFEALTVRRPDLVFQTRSTEFLLEAMSGGMSAIVELAWQIFLQSRQYDAFTVCIDEPENHLHPELQRSILPGLLKAFPHIRFIVATHSPFVVTSVRESNVYVLEGDDTGVSSRLLEHISKSTGADETLRRVLGMETTFPLWVERELDEVLSSIPTRGPSPDDISRLKDALIKAGLASEYPAAVDALLRDDSDATSE